MTDDLKATEYCDIHHPSIQALASANNTGYPVETARKLFYYVRDRIVTGYDLYAVRASRILEQGYGICWGKSLLLTALLRANGIPARFGTIPVHRRFIRPLIGSLHYLANSPYYHCVTLARLNSRWTVLDTVLDKTTYETFFVPAGVAWGIDWNGADDCRLYTESVVGEPMNHDNLDEAIRQKAGNQELPAFIAKPLYNAVNRRIWVRTGQAARTWSGVAAEGSG